MKNLSFINKLIFLLNVLSVISLMLSYAAAYINPNETWLPALFGLFYPVLFFINIFFVVFWIILRKWLLLFSLLILLSGLTQIKNHVGFNFFIKSNSQEKSKNVKVLTYNVRCFDLYNWSNNKNTRNKIFNLMRDENPDIMNLQEFYTDDTGEFKTHDTIIKFLNAKYAHIEIGVTAKRVHHWGLATYSRFPIVNKGKIDFEQNGSNMCIFTDIKMETDTVRVYNCHFQSIHFSKNDYKYLKDLQDTEKDTEWKGSLTILKRLKLAFGKRAKQADAVATHMASSPYKIILTGDFNDTPTSYSYTLLSENLEDAFKVKGSGLGRTYINNFFPLRIDYILTSPEISIVDYKELPQNYSDHYPIRSTLRFKK